MVKVTQYFRARDVSYDTSKGENNEIIFRKNKVQLKNDEQESITEQEFKKQIKDEVSKYIHPFDSVIVLAGAGASVVNDSEGNPDKNYGHTIRMLAEAVGDVLKADDKFFTIKKMSDYCHYDIPRTNENEKETIKEDNSQFVLEDFLSKVLAFEEFMEEGEDKKKYVLTINRILKVIVEKTSYSLDAEKHKHASLINILSNMIKTPERLTVVTTNYDTLFEEAAEQLNYIVFDGFSFTTIPKFDIDLFDWSLVKPISNVKSDKVEYKKQMMNLLKIHGSLTWRLSGDDVVRDGKITDIDITDTTSVRPLMIFPSSNKYSHSYEKPYFELFSKFQELLKRPNTLLITTGFGFADNHITKMITQAVKTSPSLSLLVTDFSIEVAKKNSNRSRLEKMMESGYKIAFLKATLDQDLTNYFGGETNDN